MIEPVVKDLVVPVDAETAFRRFTEEIGAWWPLATHSVFPGESVSVTFEGRVGGRLFESAPGDREAEWGVVTAWEPPHRVAFTWYPGRTSETAQPVEVTFTPVAGGTHVHLVHAGWEILGDQAAEVRAGYDEGWTPVLAAYEDSLRVAV